MLNFTQCIICTDLYYMWFVQSSMLSKYFMYMVGNIFYPKAVITILSKDSNNYVNMKVQNFSLNFNKLVKARQ